MEDDFSVLWRPAIDGVEVLHARFRRHEYAKHAHDAATVALVDTGTVSFDYRGERFLAPAGSVFLLDTDRAHTGRAASSAGYRYRVLYLDTDVLRPFLTPEAGRPPRLAFRDTVVWDSTLVALLDRTHRALTTPGRRLLQEEMLIRVSALLFDRYSYARPPKETIKGGHRAVSAARDYLEAHSTENVSLQVLAHIARSSPHRLARMFTAEVGMPPHTYQTRLRLRLARRLLAAGSPIAEVAARAGFYDQAHLTRVFKKYIGVTPRQFSLGISDGNGVERALAGR
ncbi:MAG TPA: AraC family transcriptional regulator [Streptosporangiaceae bacterium]|jgi:AraC-like DNA-binding protein|nr:AraC family transcriptional regulator [Streptosporangiaceae bacterium]